MNAKVKNFDAKVSAVTIVELLKIRYPQPEWLTMDEVVVTPRRFDFLAARLWGDAHHILGFEVKVERGDYLKELSDPDKRRALEQRCHAAYFVAPAGLIAKAEVPQGWGLIELAGTQLREKVAARHRNKCELVHESVFAMARKMLKGKEADVVDRRIFKYAGQDLTAEQLAELTKTQFGDAVDKAKQSLRDEMRKRDEADHGAVAADKIACMTEALTGIAKRLDLSTWGVQRRPSNEWLAALDRHIAERCPVRLLEQAQGAMRRGQEQLDRFITDLRQAKHEGVA
jgi:hypothetical protein